MYDLLVDASIFALQKAGGISRLWGEILLQLDRNTPVKVVAYVPKNRNIEWQRVAPQLQRIKVIRRFPTLYRAKVWHNSFYTGFPKRFKGKKAVTFYDMIDEVHGQRNEEKYQTLRQADEIISISEASKRDLQRIWPEIDKPIRVVPCALSFDKQEPQEPQRYFLFVGKRGGYKNFFPLMQQLQQDSRFSSYRVKVVGGGEWTQEEKNLDLSRIDKYEIVPREQIEKLLACATVLLYPSLYEGFGLPILEAFAAGVPVLACNTSSIPEVVGPDYPLAQPDSLCDTLAALLEDREQLVSLGKKRLSHFSAQSMIASYI